MLVFDFINQLSNYCSNMYQIACILPMQCLAFLHGFGLDVIPGLILSYKDLGDKNRGFQEAIFLCNKLHGEASSKNKTTQKEVLLTQHFKS